MFFFSKTFLPSVQQQLPATLLVFVASRLFGWAPVTSVGSEAIRIRMVNGEAGCGYTQSHRLR